MSIVVLKGTEYVGPGRAQIERKKGRVRICHKCRHVKKRVLTVSEVRRKNKRSEECPCVRVSYVELADSGPVPIDVDIGPK